ncbi:hypothetical protein M23134_02617 [Microscilla marina ATCC 23134]|uniref:Uncharacterized protein n=1 Tax=Microscilla marina ATCC 23134 TaxID=313606 RepID=A1ZNQ9_MICM2|nr:hypothetical protein M23134_02617 [Microscilla marina ATCC 23134]
MCLWASLAMAQSDYTLYQLAFKRGNRIITIQPDLTTAKAVDEVHVATNDLSQYLILRNLGNKDFLIASAAAPNHLLGRLGNSVNFKKIEYNNIADVPNNYKWRLMSTISRSNEVAPNGGLFVMLQHSSTSNLAMFAQNDGSLQFTYINSSGQNDRFRLYVKKKLVPGKF